MVSRAEIHSRDKPLQYFGRGEWKFGEMILAKQLLYFIGLDLLNLCISCLLLLEQIAII